jgi:deazaflavin-dependent oxidoreductase (nitroreductase family)
MISKDVRAALLNDRTIDITTIGRRSGRPRRIEIWFHNFDGRIYISGLPGRRGWYANLLTRPEFMLHLKQSTQADVPARARPVTDPAEREQVLRNIVDSVGRPDSFNDWVDRSPVIEVELL